MESLIITYIVIILSIKYIKISYTMKVGTINYDDDDDYDNDAILMYLNGIIANI